MKSRMLRWREALAAGIGSRAAVILGIPVERIVAVEPIPDALMYSPPHGVRLEISLDDEQWDELVGWVALGNDEFVAFVPEGLLLQVRPSRLALVACADVAISWRMVDSAADIDAMIDRAFASMRAYADRKDKELLANFGEGLRRGA